MDDEKKTKFTLSITPEDKKFLKMYALKHDVSVAVLVERWIDELRKKEGESDDV